ncbi:MAG: competence/damage-inducible protein A [Syntrophomonadaceae bacterium]|jgi:nicotinamide-nucleotide amidase|nr:competence/damage-inducible protein A [Syntrophomonadaceae bacterium]
MKTAYIVSTGTELLLGNTIDTNALYLSRELSAMGIRVIGRTTVGDNREMIVNGLRTGYDLAELVVCTGGLGPTLDDLSREAAAEVLNLPLVHSEPELERIRRYFACRRREMPESNRKQAMFPAGARILVNRAGTASGFMVSRNGKNLVLLPGPPREMEVVFKESLQPLLRDLIHQTGRVVLTRTIKVVGLGESQVESLLGDVIADPDGCSIALLAKDGEVHIRVTRDGATESAAESTLESVIERMRKNLGDNIYGEGDETLPGVIVRLLSNKGHNVALAESCTGGMAAKMLTDIPGSSAVFWGGVVSYSNEAKTRILGVSDETLKRYGAVSPETAREMARGMRNLAGSTFGISLTGIAGPEGGTYEKPVGLVYLGMATAEGEETRELRLMGGRDGIRTLAARTALDWLRRTLERE